MPPVSRRSFLASGSVVGAGLVAGCLGGDDDSVHLQVDTAAEGASHYNMSAPWVELLPDHSEDPALNATVSSSDGSVANMRALDDGEIDVGTSVDQIGHLAYNGQGPFDGNEIDIRCIMRGELVPQYYVVQADSDIDSIWDLDGRSVTPGPEGGGTTGQHEALMDQYGLETDDVYLSYGEGGRALRDGDVDAWFVFHGSDAINAFATDGDELELLEFDDEAMEGLQEVFPWTVEADVTPDMLENYEETTGVMGTHGYWMTTPEMDDDVVYELCRVVTSNPEPIRDSNVNSEEFGLEFAHYDFGVPYHDAAIEFFEDEGVL
ncbi:TAXI family TRAP transporter solute-binding subunit [Natrialba swarupiae]|uniref:TAXI family TRAP transporter solute-binding subunit n=1 Tax=Natrialba swarupiae TaxID=2448032 RepID=A0A5D5ANT1_9EURY|nr:TAXI family TRAP transporter solute-binding subunit [Natrialba swarupiae]TYT62577.1 TAXI family TRAP transporter solute-binding subunit [Natrialba swarupiae]